MNISSQSAARSRVPQVNSYRMGVQQSFLGKVEYPIDSREEYRAQTAYDEVKVQHNELASYLTSLDNTRQDRDPFPGQVTRLYQAYDVGSGNYVDETIDFSYSTTTGVPLDLRANGRYSTPLGIIDMEKQVSWDSAGQTAFQDTRYHKDSFGHLAGTESVRGFQFSSRPGEPIGLEYQQKRQGRLLPH